MPVIGSTEDATDVSSNYAVLIALYGWCLVVDAVRDFMMAFYYKNNITSLEMPICILALNYLVQLVVVILHHVFRLRHAGMVCSGDYLSKQQRDPAKSAHSSMTQLNQLFAS